MGALAVVGEVLAFAWDHRRDIEDIGQLVFKAVGLSSKENPTEDDIAEVRDELAMVRARRRANNARIEDTSRD